MNAIDSKQATIFVVVFSVIALLINSTQGFGIRQNVLIPPASILTVPTVAQQASQTEANERAQFQARYLNGGLNRQTGKQGVAIVVADENGKLDSAVSTALANRFQDESVQIFPVFFTTAFISDGLINDAIARSSELFQKLDLAHSLSALVLAREDVQYSQNAALDNVITATMRLDVIVVPVAGQGSSQTWTFTAVGPGFTQEVARAAAQDRLIKQIASDIKMSLN